MESLRPHVVGPAIKVQWHRETMAVSIRNSVEFFPGQGKTMKELIAWRACIKRTDRWMPMCKSQFLKKA
jgi:hypothetical protein